MGKFSAPSRGRRLRDLHRLQSGLCAICGGHTPEPGAVHYDNPLAPSLEHIWPRGMRTSGADEFVMTHRECNNKRRDTPPTIKLLRVATAVRFALSFEKLEAVREAS